MGCGTARARMSFIASRMPPSCSSAARDHAYPSVPCHPCSISPAACSRCAQTGLHFTPKNTIASAIARSADIAARLLELQSRRRSADDRQRAWFVETGYATPKIEVRGAIFRGDRGADGARACRTANGRCRAAGPTSTTRRAHAVQKEIEQESGFTARVLKLAAVVRSQQARTSAVPVSCPGKCSSSARSPAASRAPATRPLPSSSSRWTRCRSCRRAARRPRRSARMYQHHLRSRPADRVRLSMSEQTAAPEWFTRAIAAPAESRFAEVDGTPIHYLSGTPPIRTSRRCCSRTAFARTRAGGASSRRSSSAASASCRSTSPAWATAATGASTRRWGSSHDIVGVLDHAGFDQADAGRTQLRRRPRRARLRRGSGAGRACGHHRQSHAADRGEALDAAVRDRPAKRLSDVRSRARAVSAGAAGESRGAVRPRLRGAALAEGSRRRLDLEVRRAPDPEARRREGGGHPREASRCR